MANLLSIVVPVYKVENYLNECVDSIICQDFDDFEIILVDDGSPDSCPRICDEYASKDTRVRVIHQKNAGMACARNSGIRVANGLYIMCIDSDDYLSNSNVLNKIAEKTHKDPDVILFGYKKYFESNGLFGKDVCPSFEGIAAPEKMLNSELMNNSYGGMAWTKAVKRCLLEDYKIEFRAGMISEDIDWYLKLMCYAKSYEGLTETVIIYRQRSGSISHTAKLKSLTDNLWILENWPRIIREQVKDLLLVESLMSVMAYYYANALILYSGFSIKVSKPYKERFKACRYLLNYSVTPRARWIRWFYKIVGFEISVFMLGVLAKIKTRN